MGVRPFEVVVIAAVGCVLTAILYPLFVAARAASSWSACLSHASSVGRALVTYSSDHDDRLPKGKDWTAEVTPYIAGRSEFSCTEVPAARYGFAMGEKVAGISLSKVEDLKGPLVFESVALIPNMVGDYSLFPDPARHHGKGMAASLDGSARSYTPKTFHAWALGKTPEAIQ